VRLDVATTIFLHLQFALLMNLYFFSFVMIMGHMSFLRRSWLARLGAWWKHKIGEMEMIYDGTCPTSMNRQTRAHSHACLPSSCERRPIARRAAARSMTLSGSPVVITALPSTGDPIRSSPASRRARTISSARRISKTTASRPRALADD
jgi:hypothetical protein